MSNILNSQSIAELLGDEKLFGNGSPTWPNAQTSETVEGSRLKLAKRLRRFDDDFPDAGELGKKLESCRPESPCTDGSCPSCSRALQRWCVRNVRRLFQSDEQANHVAISIVFPDGRVAPNDLRNFDPAQIIRLLAKTLKSSGVVDWAVMGLDVSLNDDAAKGFEPAWQLQLYGTAQVRDSKELSAHLRTRYRSSDQVSRPVQIKTSDGSRSAISYAHKHAYVRRVSYAGISWSSTRENQACWLTRKVSLRAREEIDLRLWLSRIGQANRILLQGLHVKRDSHGLVQLHFDQVE